MTFTEGPGIRIVPNETLLPTDEPTYTIAIDEEYVSKVIEQKYGLTLKPREGA